MVSAWNDCSLALTLERKVARVQTLSCTGSGDTSPITNQRVSPTRHDSILILLSHFDSCDIRMLPTSGDVLDLLKRGL